MGRHAKLGMAVAATLAATWLYGCGNVPGATTPPGPASLQGRLTFAGNQPNQNPGQALTVRLKQRLSGQANFSTITTTTQTDNSGNFTFTGLAPGEYQVEYDDEGKVAATSFNTTGVAVSDPVTVTAGQTSAPQVTMELFWDFTSAQPQPNANVARTGQSFSWPAKAGVASPVYQATIFNTPNTGSGALQTFPSSPTTATSTTVDLTSAVAAGTRYLVVKYWKSGGSFGGANYYGQTKPIPINVP